MYRANLDSREFFAPPVASRDPSTWPNGNNSCTEFWGFVAHAYKGYHYYTGSDFPADKKSYAKFAHTSDELLVHVRMEDPVMPAAAKNCADNSGDYYMADHVTVNIVTPSFTRYLFSVNPVGARRTEKNAQSDAGLEFDARIEVRANEWEVLFAIPFATLECDPDATGVLAFDIVRQEQGDSAVTTLSRARITPPYNFLYEYPVFHFSPLYLGKKCALPAGLFEDATEGFAVRVREGATVRAGALCEIALDVTVGKNGLHPGGRIRMCHSSPVLNCGVHWTLPQDWDNVQTANPRGAGYLSIRGADFKIETNGIYTTATYTGDRPLAPGEKLEVRIGDRRQGGPGIRAGVVNDPHHRMAFNIDARANRIAEPVLPWPEINIVNNDPVDIVVSNPGAVPAGKPFEVCVRLVDRFGNLAGDFVGRVALYLDAAQHSFPKEIDFAAADRGARLIEGVVESRGVYSFAAVAGCLSGQGNYLATDGSFGDGYILYGDVHCHTSSSDGWRTVEEKVFESRYMRGLNFMATADHDFDMSPDKWAHFKAVARATDEPGRFVNFLAHEWTPSAGHGKPFHRQHPGHYVIVFPGFEGDLLRANAQNCNSPEKLFAAAREQNDLMVIPHYHGKRPPIDPEIGYALEMAAWDGKVAETEDDATYSVFSTLNEGWKVGLIAGTDHGGEGLRVYRNGEMFSVLVPEFDRDAIRDAIKQRRTVAITHSRALLKWTLNGAEMGAEIALDRNEPRVIAVRAACRPYPLKIQLIRNGRQLREFNNSGRSGSRDLIECRFTDEEPLAGNSWYMIRLMLHGGEKIWSSPIWTTVT